MLKTGKRENPHRDYIKIDPSILNGYVHAQFSALILSLQLYLSRRVLRINDVRGKAILLLLPSMPKKMKSKLGDRLRSIFPTDFISLNSKLAGARTTFPCSHYTFYN
jgi:hypothetical protein